MTDQQQAYLIGRTGSFELGNVSTHAFYEYEGELDIDRFNHAWRRAIDRHDMLRAVMVPERNEQRVLPEVPPFSAEIVDLRGLDESVCQEQLATIRDRMSHEVRPADEWPLFGVLVSRLDNRRARVHISFDALTLDYLSWQLLVADLTRFYANPDLEMPPLDLTFRDYVLAESGIRHTEQYRRAEEYWRERLPTLPAAPQLPFRADPGSIRYPRWSSRAATLAASDWQALRSRAGKAGLTPTALCLALFAEVLATWSTSPRFTVNVPRMNRFPLHPQANQVLGEFASFTLLEVDGGRDGEGRVGTFTDRAQAIQRQLWRDLTHQQVSGVRMLRQLIRSSGGFERALMPVVLTSTLGFTAGDRPLLGAQLPRVFAVSQTPQVFIDVQIEDQGGKLLYNWDTVDAVFPAGLIDDAFDAFRSLLQRLAVDERSWSSTDLTLVPDEHQTRRGLCGPTPPVPDQLVQTSFECQARRRPEQAAVITSARVLTYDEVYRRATGVGHWLRDRNLSGERPVAVVMDKGWEQVVAAFGALFAGAPYLPIDVNLPPHRLRHILAQCEVDFVLTQSRHDGRWKELVDELDIQVLAVDDPVLDGLSPDPLAPLQGPDDLAYVLFTSGSSGQPKGVMIEHRGMVNCLQATLDEFAVGSTDRCLSVTALHHDMSTFDIFGVLGAGGTLVLPDADRDRDAAHWAELVERHRVTVWNSVPAMMEMLLEHIGGSDRRAGAPISSLRLAFLGGDWIPLAVPQDLFTLVDGIEVVSVGGPTETTLWNIWYRIGDIDASWRSVPYGRPIANTRYYVLDERMQDRPDWVTGELYCSGPGVARGYWADPARTEASFVLHPHTGERLYRTGDLGRCLPDGNIEFVGRADAQVKIRGHRIELGDIEAALEAHPLVRSSVVTAVANKDRPGHRALAAYVTIPGMAVAVPDEIKRHLRDRLPQPMVPATVTIVDSLPLTANGKVDRRALQARTEAGLDLDDADGGGFVAPRTALEEVVAQAWSEILAVPRVGVHDDFFALGGDSVLATTIITRLRDHLDSPELSLTSLFATLSAAGMASALAAAEEVPGRLEQIAEIYLHVARLSTEEVQAELGGEVSRSA